MTDITSLTVGLVILGVVLLLLIVLNILGFFWIVGKLRQHEHDILRIQDNKDKNIKHPKSDYIKLPDTDIELSYSRALMANEKDQCEGDSKSRDDHARLSIKIKKEVANVYGSAGPLGQVMMTAQHYYKVKTSTCNDVPIENVKIIDTETNRLSAVSGVLSEDWKEGRPTSILFRGNMQSFVDLINQNKGVFVHKMIGPEGGSLEVSGVTLVIPPNALEDDRLISLGELWDTRFVPRLSKKQSLISPVVLCQPSGLQFKFPVTLTFSHSAINVTSDWSPKILKREGDLNENNEWEPVTLADYEDFKINDANISMKLNHFTLYTCTGESKPGRLASKLVHIVAFAGKLQKGSFYKPRLYCINKFKDELDEVEKIAVRMDASSKITDTTNLIIHDNEQDVMVEMTLLTENWHLAGARTEVLPFEQIWHAFTPHCMFVMKPKTSTVAELFCEIEAYQNGAENNSAKLKIAEKMSQSMLLPPIDDPREELINELVILLDPQNEASSNMGDYRNLAERMKCGLARVRWLGTQSSPTRILIEKWLDEGNSLRALEQIMRDIKRVDAAEEIRKRSQHFESLNDL